MAKLWAGRTSGDINAIAEEFNSSIGIDCRLLRYDIRGSLAHAAMLASRGIIPAEAADSIEAGLEDMLRDLDSGVLEVDMSCEDIHTFVEQELTARIGDDGKMLHTARSRNDQVALDIRMYLRDGCEELTSLLKELISVLVDLASLHKSTVMPGYTHMQRAQPVTFAHHILAYAMMLLRDIGRLEDCRGRMNVSPVGSCALAGTTYDTDRYGEAEALGFDGICMNSMDGVSDRDFCAELLGGLAIVMMHLSRFSEELILWSGREFAFIEISDDFSTGSSIMPQKKNPDIAELVRGKTGRVYGDLTALLTTLKGLPLAYNKDMQEDKECVFDAVDTVAMCLKVFTPMVAGIKVNSEAMRRAAGEGFINATDLADYLVRKGIPFRTAYRISGEIVADCIEKGLTLETYPLEEYCKISPLFESDVYESVDLMNCAARRSSTGGPAESSVSEQIEWIRARIWQEETDDEGFC